MSSNEAYHFAVALLRYARRTGELRQVERDLGDFVALMDEERRVTYLLLHPLVPDDRKEQFLQAAASVPVVRQLVRILMRIKNLGLAREVYSQYSALVRREMGVVRATMTTATALSQNDQERLKAALERLMGKRVDLETRIDPEVLAGVWVRIGDRVMDNTLRTELNLVKERLVAS